MAYRKLKTTARRWSRKPASVRTYACMYGHGKLKTTARRWSRKPASVRTSIHPCERTCMHACFDGSSLRVLLMCTDGVGEEGGGGELRVRLDETCDDPRAQRVADEDRCMYVCMHVCRHTCMHACMHVRVCVCVCVCVCVYVCVRMHGPTYACMHSSLWHRHYLRQSLDADTYMQTCVHACIRACTHMHACRHTSRWRGDV